MDLTEEQNVRAQKLADTGGSDFVSYFNDVIEKVTKEIDGEVGKINAKGINNLREKQKSQCEILTEIDTQCVISLEKGIIEIEVVREAYRIWYERKGKKKVHQEDVRAMKKLKDKIDSLAYLYTRLMNCKDAFKFSSR
jgi:hypothetical protein